MPCFCFRAFSNIRQTVCLPAGWAGNGSGGEGVNALWATLDQWAVGANGQRHSLCPPWRMLGASCVLLCSPGEASPFATAAPWSHAPMLAFPLSPRVTLSTPSALLPHTN